MKQHRTSKKRQPSSAAAAFGHHSLASPHRAAYILYYINQRLAQRSPGSWHPSSRLQLIAFTYYRDSTRPSLAQLVRDLSPPLMTPGHLPRHIPLHPAPIPPPVAAFVDGSCIHIDKGAALPLSLVYLPLMMRYAPAGPPRQCTSSRKFQRL